jgi:hypothetical protein
LGRLKNWIAAAIILPEFLLDQSSFFTFISSFEKQPAVSGSSDPKVNEMETRL